MPPLKYILRRSLVTFMKTLWALFSPLMLDVAVGSVTFSILSWNCCPATIASMTLTALEFHVSLWLFLFSLLHRPPLSVSEASSQSTLSPGASWSYPQFHLPSMCWWLPNPYSQTLPLSWTLNPIFPTTECFPMNFLPSLTQSSLSHTFLLSELIAQHHSSHQQSLWWSSTILSHTTQCLSVVSFS